MNKRENSLLSNTPIIDAHTHLGSPPEMYTPAKEVHQVIELMDHLGIDLCICSHLTALQGSLNEGHRMLVEEIKEARGRILGFAVFNPHYPNESMKWVKECSNLADFVAVKIHPALHCYPPDGEKYRILWNYVAHNDIPIMSHTWDYDPENPAQNFSHPSLFAEIAEKYPSLKLILGHAGGRYNAHLEAIKLAREYGNIYLELAGDSFLPGLIEYFVKEIDVKKILYGSDMIWIDPRYHLGSIMEANINEETKKKILGQNAIEVYNLKERILSRRDK